MARKLKWVGGTPPKNPLDPALPIDVLLDRAQILACLICDECGQALADAGLPRHASHVHDLAVALESALHDGQHTLRNEA